MRRLQEPLGGLLSWLIPRAQIVPAIPLSSLSHDPAVISDFTQDPLNFHGVMRARTAVELARGFVAIRKARHNLKMPVYAHHGTADAITSPKVRPAGQGSACAYALHCCSGHASTAAPGHTGSKLCFAPSA